MKCDIGLTGDMVTLRLSNAIFEINVPESSLVVSFVGREDAPIDIRNEHIQVKVPALEGDGISVDS